MIYYFCGHRGCGKNFLANQLTRYVPIKIIDTGPIIREAYKKYNTNNSSFKEWIEENEKRYGKNFSNMVISKIANIKKENDYIVIGYRSINGIKYFNDYFGITDYQIYFIDGDYTLFRKNYNTREKTDISKEEYEKIVKIEESMGIKKIKEFVLNNKYKGKYYFKKQNDDIIFQDILKEIKERIIKEERERLRNYHWQQIMIMV